MKNSSYFWELGGLTDNQPTYHHRCYQVIVCISVFSLQLHMPLLIIALSPSFTILGTCLVSFCVLFFLILYISCPWTNCFTVLNSGLAHLNLLSLWPSTTKQFAVTKYRLACVSGWCLKRKNQEQEGIGHINGATLILMISLCTNFTHLWPLLQIYGYNNWNQWPRFRQMEELPMAQFTGISSVKNRLHRRIHISPVSSEKCVLNWICSVTVGRLGWVNCWGKAQPCFYLGDRTCNCSVFHLPYTTLLPLETPKATRNAR